MKLIRLGMIATLAVGLLSAGSGIAADLAVGITRSIDKLEGTLDGKPFVIVRNQDQSNTVNPAFAKTSRKCPPFCIQPQHLAEGVETIGELEVLGYIEKIAAGDKSVLLIDSRTPDWAAKGTIPGAINVPWTRLNPSKGADPISITEILTNLFGARDLEGLWDFDDAKTLVLFCNGMWCGQSPNNIQNLLRFGYPAHKIKWYRGGMQDWEILGLTTVKP
ncbi:MAG: rhodanese-like domain-containing protein [Chromatiaceae bacterium]|nr:rhodanese-like domain-containing protein [Chromatiaceae bacterium]